MGVRLMRVSQAPWFTSLLLLVGGAIANQSIAASDAKKVTLHIAPQPVCDALSDFGRQTGLTVMIQSAVGQGLISPKIDGEYFPADALKQILADSGLRFEYLDDKTVAVLQGQHNTPNQAVHPASVMEDSRNVAQGVNRGPAISETQGGETDSGAGSSTNSSDTDSKKKIEEVLVTGTQIRGIENGTAPVIVL